MLNRPNMTEERLAQIRHTIQENPGWGRTRISRHLCELWEWRVPGGQYKDVSCRDMLRALDKAGQIELPAMQSTLALSPRKKVARQNHDTTPVACALGDLRPLGVHVIERGQALAEFKSLIAQHHYLGFERTVGENMKYIVRSSSGALLACLLFGSAAWKCRDRDAYIGWSQEQRRSHLPLLANNVRFLIPAWVRVPCLASHILSAVSQRLSADWEAKYGHPILLLETFVETGRFQGTSYKAANWLRVGRTAGRGRNDRLHAQALPEKDIYLLPLARRWRDGLLAG
jgi:hypothetical protein